MSPEIELHSPPPGFTSTREDLTLSRGELDSNHEPGRRSKVRFSPQTKPESQRSSGTDGKTALLKLLIEAEAAANSAAMQLVSFKNALEDVYGDYCSTSLDKRRLSRQKELLLEKIEHFRVINKSVRQKLKCLQTTEVSKIDADKQIDSLLRKMVQAESENERLRRDLSDMEKRVEELIEQRKEEQNNIRSAVQMTKSVEVTRARLQGHLRSKEAENSRLTVQLRTLEKTLMDQKMEIDDLRGSITCLSEKAAQDKELLKKATRAQKQRADKFEAAVEKCYAQLKEKDEQLADARSEMDSRRLQKEQITDEKEKLIGQVSLLKSEMAALTLRLHLEKDQQDAGSASVEQKLKSVIRENQELTVSNAALKSSVAQMEHHLADCESALVNEKIVSQEKKLEVERSNTQVAELQAEVESLRLKLRTASKETQMVKDGRDMQVQTVRRELQRRVDELKPYSELLSASERGLLECQESLKRLEKSSSEKSDSIKLLQAKMESQASQLRSTGDMSESVHAANVQLQEKSNSLQRQIDRLQQENVELVRKLAYQEEALSYSKGQLDQRSTDCQALNRQLDSALSDVRQQVKRVKDQATTREEALKNKILDLEAERNKKDKELQLLRQSKITAEKQFEARLKDLQLSLDQSESHKRSIQNYIDFLKKSYRTMFDDGLHATTFGSLYFQK